jgi:hypothetical protein
MIGPIADAIRAAEAEAKAVEREAILQAIQKELDAILKHGGDAHTEADLESVLEIIRARGTP